MTRPRWIAAAIMALLAVSTFLNYLDRATISISAPLIKQDLGLSATQVGGLLSVFSISYAIGSLPAGFLVDRLGVRFFTSAAILVWSLAQGVGGLVIQISCRLIRQQ